jgi:hypothetical protein
MLGDARSGRISSPISCGEPFFQENSPELMRPEFLFSLYAGPDQVMGVTSGLAGLLGLLLVFWNKVAGTFFKILGKFRPTPEAVTSDASKSAPTETP